MVYTFSDGKSTTVIKSNNTQDYSDDKWHVVEFSRDENGGKLVLDGQVFDKQDSSMQKLDVKHPIYVGGLDPDHYNLIQGNLVSFINYYY